VSDLSDRLTAAALMALAGLHVAWGRGSAVPFADRERLADAVIGRRSVPEPAACYAVAVALGVGATLVVGPPALPDQLRRVGLVGVAGVLGLRGVLGLIGRTDVVSPGSASDRFRRLDRRIYSPLCLSLAAGAIAASGR
jgi:Protein of unknown function (DUF3995)